MRWPISARCSSPWPWPRQAFLQPDQDGARQTWRHVADQLREYWPKLGMLMDDSEHDVLAYMAFPGPSQDEAALDERWSG
jgi:hypothetical protein